MPSRIALVTDFGSSGPYTGQIHLLLQGLVPSVPVVDLISDLTPFRPDLAAYLLPSLIKGMPKGTLYLCVVDPGVGGDRGAVVVEADGDWFVGPDNGLFAPLSRRAGKVRWWRIHWRPPQMSVSFHGRDLFAPIAARILKGEDLSGVEMAAGDAVGMDWPEQNHRVIYLDHYGNLCTGIEAAYLDRGSVLSAGGQKLSYARTFSNVSEGDVFWYRNSFGLVELAANCDRADKLLGLQAGDEVQLI